MLADARIEGFTLSRFPARRASSSSGPPRGEQVPAALLKPSSQGLRWAAWGNGTRARCANATRTPVGLHVAKAESWMRTRRWTGTTTPAYGRVSLPLALPLSNSFHFLPYPPTHFYLSFHLFARHTRLLPPPPGAGVPRCRSASHRPAASRPGSPPLRVQARSVLTACSSPGLGEDRPENHLVDGELRSYGALVGHTCSFVGCSPSPLFADGNTVFPLHHPIVVLASLKDFISTPNTEFPRCQQVFTLVMDWAKTWGVRSARCECSLPAASNIATYPISLDAGLGNALVVTPPRSAVYGVGPAHASCPLRPPGQGKGGLVGPPPDPHLRRRRLLRVGSGERGDLDEAGWDKRMDSV